MRESGRIDGDDGMWHDGKMVVRFLILFCTVERYYMTVLGKLFTRLCPTPTPICQFGAIKYV